MLNVFAGFIARLSLGATVLVALHILDQVTR